MVQVRDHIAAMNPTRWVILLVILSFAVTTGCTVAIYMGMKSPVLYVIPEDLLANPRFLSFYFPVGLTMFIFAIFIIILIRAFRIAK
jgi:hypothetical protein